MARATLIILLVGLLGWCVVDAAPAETQLTDFARHARFRDIKISPEGDYVAASAVVDGKAVLSLIHLADMKGVNLRPRDDDEIADFWWVDARRVVYSISQKTEGLEQPLPTGELFAVNADGGSERMLVGFRDKGEPLFAFPVEPVFSSNGRMLVSLFRWNGSRDGAYPVASWLDVDSGRTIPVVTAPIRSARFVADNEGRVRFAYAQDVDQNQRVYYRDGEKGDWSVVFDEKRGDPPLRPMRFDRSGSKVYFACDGAHGVGGVCLWDVETRKLTTLWSGTEADVLGTQHTFDDKDIFAIRSMPGRPQVVLVDKNAAEAKLLATLLGQFPGEDVVITSHSRGGAKVVFFVHSDTDPGSYYLYDAAQRKAALLFARMPWIKPDAMSPTEPVSLRSRDGLPLHGYLTRPRAAAADAKLPMVVYVHGGPYGIRDVWGFDPTVQALASRGYAVLQVNYRGSGGYGRGFEQAGIGEWGRKMQDDVTDATQWAIQKGFADPKRICIFGGSYGGYAALEGAVREPDLYRCAIGYVGVYDLRLMYTRGDIPQSTYGDNYLKRVLGEDEAVLWDRSPIAHIDRLKAKIMLIVGGADKRVPPVQGESLHYALQKAHIDHEWLYKRTEGHGFYDEANRTEFLTRVTAFLDDALGSGAEH